MTEEERIGMLLDAITDLELPEIKELIDKLMFYCEKVLTEEEETMH